MATLSSVLQKAHSQQAPLRANLLWGRPPTGFYDRPKAVGQTGRAPGAPTRGAQRRADMKTGSKSVGQATQPGPPRGVRNYYKKPPARVTGGSTGAPTEMELELQLMAVGLQLAAVGLQLAAVGCNRRRSGCNRPRNRRAVPKQKISNNQRAQGPPRAKFPCLPPP